MERVRIRSLLNNFKYNQKCLSTTKDIQIDESIKIVPAQKLIAPKQEVNPVHHSCFLIEPLVDTERQNKSTHTLQVPNSHYSTPKQGGKRRTKIANRSYMMTLTPRNKNGLENLKQLGIRTKKISERCSKSTEKFLKLDTQHLKHLEQIPSEFIPLIKVKPQIQNQKLKTQIKKPVSETYRQKFQQKNNKPLTVLLPWNKNKVKMFHFAGYPQIKDMKYAKGYRKNSDICPWDMESPL